MNPGISCLFDEPPALAAEDVYDIGFADGKRNLGKRQTFMLHRWAADQQRDYDRGYSEGQANRAVAIQAVVPAGFSKCLSHCPGTSRHPRHFG